MDVTRPKGPIVRTVAACALVGAGLFMLAWWAGDTSARRLDSEYRQHLLQQATAIANLVNPELARKLTFTPSDEGAPAFEQIRDQMVGAAKRMDVLGVCSTIQRQGKIYFGPQSYPKGSSFAAAPGSQDHQPPPEFLAIDSKGLPVVAGPYTNEHGTFLSAQAPVLDSQNGGVLCAVRVDVSDRTWRESINAARRRPMITMAASVLVLWVGVGLVTWQRRKLRRDSLKLKAWIVVPVGVSVLGGLVLFGWYAYSGFASDSQRHLLQLTDRVESEWNQLVLDKAKILGSETDDIFRNPAMLKAWKARDLAALENLAEPEYRRLRHSDGITNLIFITPDGNCFLRAHQPDIRGDLIDWPTLRSAKATDEDSWGLEPGNIRCYTLRYDRPWKEDGKTIGYLDLGMDAEVLVPQLAERTNLRLLLVYQKKYISRAAFEADRRDFGYSENWDAYPDLVVPVGQAAIASDWLKQAHDLANAGEVFEARQGDRRFICSVVPLPDILGRNVGGLILMDDVTLAAASSRADLALSLGIAFAVFGSILTLLLSITDSAERQLAASFAQVHRGEELLAATFRSIGDGVICTDQGGKVTSINPVAEVLTGWYTKEAYGCCIAEIFHLVHTQSGEAAEIPVNRAMTEGRVVGLDNHVTLIARDGSVRKIADSCAPIRDAKGRVIGSVLVFRDVTAEYEARERITQANIRLKQSRDEIQQSESKFREIAETIHEVFFVCDADCRTLHYVSPAYEEVWGRSCASAYKDARSFADAIVPEDRARVFAAVEKMTESGYDEKYRITRPDGTMRWIHARGFCVRDGDGQVQRVVGLAADVTNEHKAMELILSKTALLEAQSETSPDGMLVVNADRRRILSNKRIFELFNVPQDIADCTDDAALHNHIVSQTKYPDAFLEKILHLYDHIEEKSSDEIELKNGMILDWYSSPVLGKDGKYYGRIWLFRDITQQKQAAEEMRKLSQVAEQIPNSVVISDLAGNMVYVNAAFTKLYEYTPDEVLGKNPRMLNSGLTSPETYTEMWGALTAGREWHGELQDQSKGGELVWQLVNICPLRDSAGKTTHYVTVMENITARKTMENELRTAALTDKLTGLPNRALICDRLQHAVLRFRRNNALHFAVLFLDIDRFKTINDSLGHDFGDLMLKEVAQRLRIALRCGDSVSRSASQDVAARLGGDEFVILLDSVASPDHAILVADRLIGNLSKPYRFGQTEVCTTVSIGVVTSINAEYTAEEVLRDADTAMYEAKLAGKGRCVLFDASMHQRVQNRLDIENDLRSAIEARQVFLMYQPIVSLKTGRIEGVEALVRWNHPRRGMLLPGEFVPIAEETGLIIPLGDWVLREACGQFACWRDQLGGSCPPSISVNLSRHQLLLSDLPQTLKQVLTTNGMTPDCLHLEITEGALMKDLAATIQMLTVIKKIGVKLEIDDFGTGYSSLACLRQFPIDVLKIDRSFVTNLNRGQDFVALVQTISQLARNLRIVVVAEGIETVQQMSTLQSLKCDLGQGYLFSKPMTPDEIATSFPLNFSVLTGQTMSEALAAV